VTHEMNALVVEDDAHSLFAISLIMRDLNIQFKRNTTGAKVYQQLVAMEPAPDFVLIDLDLPNADACSILHKLNTDPKTLHIPIIAIGDSNCSFLQVRALQLGAVDFMLKPFSRRQFAERVSIATGYTLHVTA